MSKKRTVFMNDERKTNDSMIVKEKGGKLLR